MWEILFYCGLFLWVVNICYWIFIERTVSKIPTRDRVSPPQGVSVDLIIVTHNDLDQIRKNLSYWTGQTFPGLKVVIADDGSDDGTGEWLHDMNYKNVEYSYYPKTSPGKKKTLAMAIVKSTADFLILTDADGRPESPNWVSHMIRKMEDDHTDICLGYGPHMPVEADWVNKLARFETTLTALQYLTWAHYGRAYMSVGRNVAYRRHILDRFYERARPDIASGDDDLFLQNVANSARISVCIDPETFVYSESPKTIAQWLDQKSRHVSAAYAYPRFTQAGLAAFAISQIGWYAIFLGPFFPGIALFIIRYTVLYLTGRHSFGKLAVRDLLPYQPMLEMGLVIYYMALLPLSLFRRKNKW